MLTIVKSRNLWNQVQEKKLHFTSIYGASMHDIEIPAQNSMHTVECLVLNPIETATFLKHPA